MLGMAAGDQSIVLLVLLPDGSSALLVKGFDDLLAELHMASLSSSGSAEETVQGNDLRWVLFGVDVGIKLYKRCALIYTGFCRSFILPSKLVVFISQGEDSILAKVRNKLNETLAAMGCCADMCHVFV